jgi:hypothetical protein
MCAPTWVSVVGIAGTWLIAIAAIWGDRIRAFLLRPRLELRVLSPIGEFLNVLSDRGPDGVVFVPTREFYIRVTNTRYHPVVNDVEVLLTRIEHVGPNGLPQHAYGGLLPLPWRHPEFYASPRKIGRTTEADVLLLRLQQTQFAFTPKVIPENFPSANVNETHLWVTLVARGLEGESPPLRLKIDWDGVWERGDAEIQRHFVLAPV